MELKYIDDYALMLADRNRKHNARLDAQEQERARVHREALAAEAAHHESIRRAAELASERMKLEMRAEIRRREEEQRLLLEKEQKRQADAEHAQRVRLLKQQEEKRKQTALKEQEIADTQRRIEEQKAKEQAEQERRKAEKAESDRKAKESAEAAKKAASTPPPVANTASTSTSTIRLVNGFAAQSSTQAPKPAVSAPAVAAPVPQPTTASPATEKLHSEYLEVHKRLKELRKQCTALAKQDKQIGEWRRHLIKNMGQITSNNKSNATHRSEIINVLKAAITWNGSQPAIDARQFVTSASPISLKPQPCMMPQLLLYFLHIFGKRVGNQLVVTADKSIAEPVMIVAAYIFSEAAFLYDSHSLVDILLAKFHKACPVLFGIYGDETTKAGRGRVGWKQVGGAFVTEAENRERLQGFAAGFASLSLRDFSGVQTKRRNPVPNTEYWRAVAVIVNTPAEQITKSHCITLQFMLEKYPERFIRIYGEMAIVVMRHVTQAFPKKIEQRFPELAAELRFMAETWRTELRLSL